MSKAPNVVGLTLFTTVMLISGSIDSIRNLPVTALFGSTLIFFFILSAIIFLIPAALVSAELSSTWSNKGGVYYWVKTAFGPQIGFIAIWLQWINTMVWYPTILSFIAATVSFLINPELAQNKTYLISVIIVTFWALTFINLRGVAFSAKFASLCGFLGLVLPMILIIALAVFWLLTGHPIQIKFSLSHLIPHVADGSSWVSLTAIMTSFLGIELATVHVNQIDNPRKNFPKAIFISTFIILVTMISGSLAIAMVLPQQEIGLVNGVMQTFTKFFNAYHIDWLLPVIVIALLIGSLGGIINWIISPAKGLLQAAEDGFFPAFISKKNRHGVESNLLIIQAIIVSFVCLAFLFMPSVNGSYWLLTALSTQLYMLMYVMMFVAAICLRYQPVKNVAHFTIPGRNNLGMWLVSLLGILGCAITLVVGFIPPEGIAVGSFMNYELKFIFGMVVMIMPAGIFCLYHRGAMPTLNPAIKMS